MANFIESGSRGRNHFVEKAVDELQTTLRDPQVSRRLGNTADQLYRLSETIYVPNITDGEVVIPDSHLESDALPVIPLRPWNNVRLEANFALYTPQRGEKALKIAKKWQPAKGSPQWFDEYQDALYRHAQRTTETRNIRGSEALAVARATSAPIDDEVFRKANGSRIHFTPRSLVILRRQHAPTPPSVFAHEIIHVAQDNAHPIFLSSDESEVSTRELRGELEAYHVGAQIATTMREGGRKVSASEEMGMRIDDLRRTINRRHHDKFAPTPELVTALGRQRLLKNLL